MLGFIVGAIAGSLGTYWISDSVKSNVHQIYQDTQLILENEEKFNERFYEKLLEVLENGELPIIMTKLEEQGILKRGESSVILNQIIQKNSVPETKNVAYNQQSTSSQSFTQPQPVNFQQQQQIIPVMQ